MTTPTQQDFEMVVADEPDKTVPEETIHKAKLVDLSIREFKWTDTKDKDRPGVPIEKTAQEMIWWFEITEGDFANRRIRGQTRPSPDGNWLTNSARNRTRQWAETLLGRELGVGARLNRSDLLGCACEISVKHVKDKKDASKIYEEIDEILPASGSFDFNSEPPF